MTVRLCTILGWTIFFSSAALSQQSASDILNRFGAAFNAHDADAMVEFVSDSVKWFTVSGDSMTTDVSGKPALDRWLRGYFKQCPSCRSEFLSMQVTGRFISIYEKALWKGKNGDRSQKSLGVYEIVNGKIQRVWYYPSEQ